jgi:hypothetical protein
VETNEMIANAPKESKGEIVLYYAPRTRAFTAL